MSPSIWQGLQPSSTDPMLEAMTDAAVQPVGPWRRSATLPLPEVDWALTVSPGELGNGATWPPTRLEMRNERLQQYHDLWRGDVSRLMDARMLTSASVGVINLFRRLPKFVADLMVREMPTVGQAGGPLADVELMRIAHSAANHVMRHGLGAILFVSTPAGPMVRALDPRYYYRTSDGGHVVVEPRIAGTPPGVTTPNALSVIVVNPDTTVTTMTIAGTPTGVAQQISVGPVTSLGTLGNGLVLTTLALPEQGDAAWGTSWYDDLITVVIQKARRMANNTRTLDGNSDPLLLLRGDLNSYTTIPGVPHSSATETHSPDEIGRDAKVSQRLRQIGPLTIPAGVEDAKYVEWDGSLEASMAMLAQIDKDTRMLTGMPAALESDTEIPSGVSLRRMFWQFDASINPIFEGLRGAMTMGLNALGYSLTWENVFDVVEGSPEMDAREDVEDESTARRGEGQ